MGRGQAQLRRAWSKRVSPEVLTLVLNNPPLARVTGQHVAGTEFFSDLQVFTTFCHTGEPERVVGQINRYLELAPRVIHRHGGRLHKFIGDGVMPCSETPCLGRTTPTAR